MINRRPSPPSPNVCVPAPEHSGIRTHFSDDRGDHLANGPRIFIEMEFGGHAALFEFVRPFHHSEIAGA